jgi:hypothetical protein
MNTLEKECLFQRVRELKVAYNIKNVLLAVKFICAGIRREPEDGGRRARINVRHLLQECEHFRECLRQKRERQAKVDSSEDKSLPAAQTAPFLSMDKLSIPYSFKESRLVDDCAPEKSREPLTGRDSVYQNQDVVISLFKNADSTIEGASKVPSTVSGRGKPVVCGETSCS